jgi:predicted metalloendopeptidase
MKEKDTLIKAFSGTESLVLILKDKLEQNGIIATIRNNSGDSFLGGIPIALDLYIRHNDIQQAEPIIREFIKKN